VCTRFDEAFAEDGNDRDRDGDERHSRRGFAPFNIQNVGRKI